MTSSTSELHNPLADGHIRLLELNLEHEHDIVGLLRTVKLTAAPPYYALSYVCGNGPYEHEVTINDTPFKVKPKTHAVLRRLQSYFRSAGTLRVWIWIDAICINQDNADEKAKQIRSMHDTFSKAEKVLVALGSVPENVHMVLSIFSWIEIYTALDPLIRSKLLERLEQIQEHDQDEAWVGYSDLQLAGDTERLKYVTHRLKTRYKVDVESLLAIKTLLERLKSFGLWVEQAGKTRRHTSFVKAREKIKLAIDFPGLAGQLFHPNHPFWTGVYELSEIEWHQRVWTYQEVVLDRNAQLFAESLSVDWNHVVAPTIGLLWAMEHDEFFEKIDSEADIVGLPKLYDRRMWYLKWQQVGGSGDDTHALSLVAWLLFTIDRKSTIAKDKVYGLLAMVRSDVRAQIPIDFATTDGKVFASAVKAGLKDAHSTTILAMWSFFDEAPSAMEDLPSWCPNFASKSGPLDPLRHYHTSYAVRQQTSAVACYEHSPGFQTIRVNVLRLDTTAGCLDIACPLDHTGSQVSSRALEAAFSDDDMTPDLTQELTELLHGTTKHESSLPFETFWEALNHMLTSADPNPQPLRVCDHLQAWAKHRDTLAKIIRYSRRYPFKTISGRIGFSTWQPTPGNRIVLLPGSDRLHMLTRDCTQYRGCVSLPEMSQEELLDLVIAREKMWEMVELR